MPIVAISGCWFMQSLMGDHIRIKPLGTRLKALGMSLLILLEFNGLVGALRLFYFIFWHISANGCTGACSLAAGDSIGKG